MLSLFSKNTFGQDHTATEKNFWFESQFIIQTMWIIPWKDKRIRNERELGYSEAKIKLFIQAMETKVMMGTVEEEAMNCVGYVKDYFFLISLFADMA